MSIYSSLAENLQYIAPDFYKDRFFKKLKNLNKNNILSRKVEPEFLWIQTFLQPDAVFVDVGANVGAYVYVLEKKLQSNNIFAFEPNVNLQKRLKRIFPKISVFPEALSNKKEIAEFKVPIIGGKKIHSRGTLQVDHQEDQEERSTFQKVEVIPMDSHTALQKLDRIDFIKIDVEGNEFFTVEGAQQTILRYKPTLMIEIEQRHHQEPIWKFIEKIKNWGYSANYLDRSTLEITPLSQELMENQNAANVKQHEHYINNIIFIPK